MKIHYLICIVFRAQFYYKVEINLQGSKMSTNVDDCMDGYCCAEYLTDYIWTQGQDPRARNDTTNTKIYELG